MELLMDDNGCEIPFLYDTTLPSHLRTFKYYIKYANTEFSKQFNDIFKESLDNIPDRVFSSKYLYDILKDDIGYSSVKRKTFLETYSEFYKWRMSYILREIDLIDR